MKLLKYIFAFLVLLCAPTAMGANWVPYFYVDTGIFSYDSASIVREGNFLTGKTVAVWSKIDRYQEELINLKMVKQIIYQQIIDCDERTEKITSITAYDKNGEVTDTEGAGTKTPIRPESASEKLWKKFCK